MTRLRLNSDSVSWREVDGEILVLDLASSRYLTLNGTGALLWKHLSVGSTREELAVALVAEFGIEPDRAVRDVDAFVSDLQTQGLLVSTTEPQDAA